MKLHNNIKFACYDSDVVNAFRSASEEHNTLMDKVGEITVGGFSNMYSPGHVIK